MQSKVCTMNSCLLQTLSSYTHFVGPSLSSGFRLRFLLVVAFSPLRIRIGGTLQDKVIYETQADNPTPCNPFIKNSSEFLGFSEGCLPMSRWDQLNIFFRQTGYELASAFPLKEIVLMRFSLLIGYEGTTWFSVSVHGVTSIWSIDVLFSFLFFFLNLLSISSSINICSPGLPQSSCYFRVKRIIWKDYQARWFSSRSLEFKQCWISNTIYCQQGLLHIWLGAW